MKKIFLAALITTTFAVTLTSASNAFAAASVKSCVPTSTVEQAQAVFNAGVAKIYAQIDSDYAAAVAKYNAAVKNELAVYNQTTASLKAKYDIDAKEIRDNHRPGWHDELVALAAKYNQDANQAYVNYGTQTQKFVATYNQEVKLAQDKFNTEGKRLADEYNKAVCAE